MDSANQAKRIDYLDSARGFAAIFVVWGHYAYQYGIQESIPLIAYSPLRFFYNAISAVSFFFILSGLVLTKKYLEKKATLNIAGYYVSRIFRIYPAFLIVIILSLACKFFLYKEIITIPSIDPSRDFWKNDVPFLQFIKEAILFVDLSGSHLIPQRWSLIVEIQISLLIPFFILIAGKKTSWFIFFIISMIICFFGSLSGIFLFHFGLGVIMAKYFDAIRGSWISLNKFKKGLLILIGICLYQYRYMVPYCFSRVFGESSLLRIVSYERLIFFSEGLGSAIILFCIIGSMRIQRVLHFKPFTFMGKISYSIYLCHFIILLGVLPFFFKFLNDNSVKNSTVVLSAGMIFITFGVLLLSAILYYCVEKPFIGIGKGFYRFFDRKYTMFRK
jgi:peptidoglycan/LPS O-acetylase OafA/YrhL